MGSFSFRDRIALNLGIEGKRALVTAGSRGIGSACAKALAAEGARVVVCARNGADLEKLVNEMGGAAAGHVGYALDLMVEGEPQAFARRLLESFGHIDLVVHNLGGTLDIRDPFGPISDWRKVLRVNFEVAVEINAVLVPPMARQRFGRVVMVSSVAGVEHSASVPYSVAKAALTAYAKGVGRTVARDGVVLCAILPGIVLTSGGTWDLRRRSDPEAVAKHISEQMPAGEFETPEQVADVVAFLCSERAKVFMGSIVSIDSGQGRAFAT